MNFKIVGRSSSILPFYKTKTIQKKRIYNCLKDYLKYKDDLIKRWNGNYLKYDIKIYTKVEKKWVLIRKIKYEEKAWLLVEKIVYIIIGIIKVNINN